jgi:hypothetical protein
MKPIVVAAVILGLASPAFAADPRYPDWPCNQIKVPELSVAAVWAGPSIESVDDAWKKDAAVTDLVTRVSARRTPLDEARKAIANFITGSDTERQDKAKLLFAGVFATLNRERSEVMNGIERFSRKQKEFADKIRADGEKARELLNAPDHDQSKVDAMATSIDWETRIFEERHKTIGYVCEVPVRIERRLFALARAIQQALE